MWIHNLKNYIGLLLLLIPFWAVAQNNVDCRSSIVICSDSSFSFTPAGPGFDDFENENNDQGCLFSRETISSWFYFEFREDMPLDQELTFVIEDTLERFRVDYDFAVYGPVQGGVFCDSLGSPLRCSFARFSNDLRPGDAITTGLQVGATDTTESFLDVDGFVKPMNVKPGEGYFLIVDMFVQVEAGGGFEEFDSTQAQAFSFDWGGPAAPFLNCVANPNCDQVVVSTSSDTTVCAGTQLNLQASAINTNNGESYRWTADGPGQEFLTNQTVANTVVDIPFDFSGELRYTIEVKEGSCVHYEEVVITVIAAPIPEITGDSLICPGEMSLLTVTENYDGFTWQDGTEDRTFLAPGPGTYSVTVSTMEQCDGVAEFMVAERQPPAPLFGGDPRICPGGTTTISIVDSLAFSSIEWSTGVTTPSIQFDQPGAYGVSLTDNFGCRYDSSLTIEQLSAPVPEIIGVPALCSGASTTLSGEEGYTAYSWGAGMSSPDINITAAGTYTLEVIDSNGCSGTNMIEVEERPNPVPSITGETLFCSMESGVLNAPAGFAKYQWSTTATDTFPDLTVRNPGRYSVTVTDDFGCFGSSFTNIDTLPRPQPVISGLPDFCAGTSTTVRLEQSYPDIQWSDASTADSLQVTSSGWVRVEVRSADGCVGVDSLLLTEIPNPEPVITGDLILCPGEETSLTTSQTYSSYQWSDGSSLDSIQRFAGGEVSVEVADANGCVGTDTVEVTSVPAPTVSVTGGQTVCEGDRAFLSATDGFVQYQWSNGMQSRAIATGVAGTYTVTVTDANGCTASSSGTIDIDNNPKPEISGREILCEGTEVSLQISGNYQSVEWSTGSTNRQTAITDGGVYSVTVTTFGNCVNADTFEVELVEPIRPGLNNGRLGICEGESLSLDGGSGFFNYSWSTGERTQAIEVDTAGIYRLTVVDSNLCITDNEVRVDVYENPRPRIVGQSSFCSGNTISLTSAGRYRNYQWSNGTESATIQIDSGGVYTLNVIDENGCSASTSRVIEEKEAPVVEIEGDNKICIGDTSVLRVRGGYQNYLWTNNETDAVIQVTEAGIYGVLVFASSGCAARDEIEVFQRAQPFPIIVGEPEICSNDTTFLQTQEEYESYQWFRGTIPLSTDSIQPANQPGTYLVQIMDDFGCDGQARIEVLTKAAPDINIDAPLFLCEGDSTFIAVPDSANYSYQWSTNATTAAIEIFEGGDYRVSVVASNGCETLDSVSIQSILNPAPQIEGDTFFCAGSTTRLQVTPSFDSIRWSDGINEQIRFLGTAGTYNFTVVNERGCSSRGEVQLSEIPLPIAAAGRDTFIDCFTPFTTLGSSLSTSGSAYMPVWSGPDISPLTGNEYFPEVGQGGTYILTVVDTIHNCPSAMDTVRIEDRQYVPAIAFAEPDTMDCRGPVQLLDATASESGPAFVYQWLDRNGAPISNGNDRQLQIAQPDTYIFFVTDTLTGCVAIDSLNVPADTLSPRIGINGVQDLSCRIDSITLTALAPPTGEQWRYSWSGPDSLRSNGQQLVVRRPGRYSLAVEWARNGCTAVQQADIAQDDIPPNISAGPDAELDCTVSRVELGENIDENPNWEVNWYNLDDPRYVNDALNPVVEEAGRYLVRVFNPINGCLSQDTAIITAYDNFPREIEIDTRRVLCFGDSNGVLSIRGVRGGEGPLLYSFDEGPFSSEQQFTGLKAGRYTVVVQDARGCELEQKVVVGQGTDVSLSLGNDQYVRQGDRVRLRALTNLEDGAIANFRWLRPDTLSCDTCRFFRDLRPLDTEVFEAIITDTSGCTARDLMTIFVDKKKDVYIPTAFSPDGDGYNDVIMIFASQNVRQVNNWQVFDRWGEMVFEKQNFQPNDPVNGWDGNWRNYLQFSKKEIDESTRMNAQVFVYQAEVEFIDGEVRVITGDFVLMK